MAGRVDSLQIVDPESGGITDHRGGARLLPPCRDSADCQEDREDGIKIEVRDAFNQRITGGIPDAGSMHASCADAADTCFLHSGLAVLAVSPDILGEQTYRARNGIVNVNQTRGVGINQTSAIEFRYQRSDGKQLLAHLNFTTRECVPGEVESDTGCSSCPADRYSFNTSSLCLDCEEHAQCPGGSVLVPEDGYWHSTPFSPRFHECIIKEACVYENRMDRLAKYYENATLVLEDLEELDRYLEEKREDKRTPRPEFESYHQCAEGYKSVLCGSCEDGYGRLDEGQCKSCPEEWQFALSVLSSFLPSVFLMILQIWTASALVSENVTITATMTRNAAPEMQRRQLYRSLSRMHSNNNTGRRFINQSYSNSFLHTQSNHGGELFIFTSVLMNVHLRFK